MAVLEVGLAALKCERGLRRLTSCKHLIICNTRRYTSNPGDQAEDALYYLCQRRHFLSGQSLTRTSVLGGCHGLGPLGVELKRNLVSKWWESMVLFREQVLGIHTLHHMPRRSSPSDNPLLSIGAESLKRLLQNRESTRDQLLWRLEASTEDYEILRPELLYGALEQYVSCLDLMNKKLPFGLAEVGPCFHLIPEENEDTSLPRTGERTVASLVWFSSPRTSGHWRDYWLRHRLQWWQKFAQCPSGFSCSDHQDDQGRKVSLIHYHFPWGKEAVESVSSVDDSSLSQVHSGSSAELQGRDGRRSVIPHILWMRGDVERGLLAYLSDAIQLMDNPGLRGKEQRRVLKIHPTLAPIKVAVDIGKGPAADLRLVCQGLATELRESGLSVWPGYMETLHVPLEHLFNRYDEMGVLFTALVSDSTLENGLIHLRSRDTTLKETLHVSKVRSFLEKYVSASRDL